MIHFDLLDATFDACKHRVGYKLGAKAALSAPPLTIHRIDCSGWWRYLMFRCTGRVWPDGSQNQLAFARAHFRQLAQYSDVTYAAADPNRLFVGFLSPDSGDEWPRHVWGVRMARTIESCSSIGVGSRRWDASALRSCKACFEVV